MQNDNLIAFFLTSSTYGTWLQGMAAVGWSIDSGFNCQTEY